MAINFHTKVVQIFADYLGYFEKWYYFSKINCGYFWGNYLKAWVLLIPTSGRTDVSITLWANCHLNNIDFEVLTMVCVK